MFQRILLCYDGSPESRRALLRGGKLAVTLKAQAIVLSIVPAGISDPSMTACLAGSLCVADDSDRFQRYLDEAVNWLITRGIDAEGVLTTGDFVEQILHHQRLFKIDLIVVGYYPNLGGGSWWSARQKRPLAERANCSVLVATSDESP